ncbi:MAG: DUF1295 domain-containing protein [Candidatus Saccharibacteria bacterium]
MTFIVASLVGLFAYMSLWYIFAIKNNDLSLVDIAYGMGFVAIALSMLIFTHPEPIRLVMALLVTVWGIRLTYMIARRKIDKPEDWRYSDMRAKWGKKYKQKAYINIFVTQGLVILIISAPVLVLANYYTPIGILQAVGLTVWLIGFLIEYFADKQLKQFLIARKDKSKVMESGLWNYTRHPNYFGEVLQWWGLWLIVVALPFGWLAIISPILITFLILFVSGIPLIEKKYINNSSYQNYAKRTSVFIPWPPKKG